MPLINCPECGRPVSSLAPACPDCACPQSAFPILAEADGGEASVPVESESGLQDQTSAESEGPDPSVESLDASNPRSASDLPGGLNERGSVIPVKEKSLPRRRMQCPTCNAMFRPKTWGQRDKENRKWLCERCVTASNPGNENERGCVFYILVLWPLYLLIALIWWKWDNVANSWFIKQYDEGHCWICDGDGITMSNGPKRCFSCEGDGRLDR
jgi:hypothetical protein